MPGVPWKEAATGGKEAWSGRDGGMPGMPWKEAVTGGKEVMLKDVMKADQSAFKDAVDGVRKSCSRL